ncbi:MAG: FHA domain-containing protein [Polyangiaceae bacterium]
MDPLADLPWELVAERTSAKDFIEKYAFWFLELEEPVAESELAFRTELAGRNAVAHPQPVARGPIMVVAISKSSRNPYADRISVGRARNSDIVLRHGSVSKLHAHFRYEDGTLSLTDVGSHNGTKLDGAALAPHRPQAVTLGCAVLFGRVHARVLSSAMAYENLRRNWGSRGGGESSPPKK